MTHITGDHCPKCFNAGYDAGLNGISPDLRDAAPELLEALKVALGPVEFMASATDADPEDHERLAFVQAAITKATG